MLQDLLVTSLALAAAAAVIWRVVRSSRSGGSGQAEPSCPNCPGYESPKARLGHVQAPPSPGKTSEAAARPVAR